MFQALHRIRVSTTLCAATVVAGKTDAWRPHPPCPSGSRCEAPGANGLVRLHRNDHRTL